MKAYITGPYFDKLQSIQTSWTGIIDIEPAEIGNAREVIIQGRSLSLWNPLDCDSWEKSKIHPKFKSLLSFIESGSIQWQYLILEDGRIYYHKEDTLGEESLPGFIRQAIQLLFENATQKNI